MTCLNVCTLTTSRRLIFLTFLIITVVCLTLKFVPFKKHSPINPLSCYRIKNETLPDFSDVNPKKGKSIFFFDASCVSNEYGKIVISERHACSVESAARTNPNMDVYLLFTSPGIIKDEGTTSDRLLKTLLTYPNVKMHYLDFEKYANNTPVEDLFKNGTIESSSFPVQHAVDVLSYLTLWKYGGTYISFDVLVLKSLENLSHNYVGMPFNFVPLTSILTLAPKGKGHYFAGLFLNSLKNDFRKDHMVYNGPGVILRLFNKICKVNTLTDKNLHRCRRFIFYLSDTFFSVPWWDYYKFFNSQYNDEVFNVTKDSYTVQLWNRYISVTSVIPKTLNISYIRFIEKYCPKVFAESKFL